MNIHVVEVIFMAKKVWESVTFILVAKTTGRTKTKNYELSCRFLLRLDQYF